ncbi:putative thymidine kinase [Helianthus annuus]|nr:putative thymidine kinase [Helianthus annuus]KAJ0641788.1 putative thymidine kinase [Helianthus annuus]KAJ0645665.1 putative thymidine kinase [Helianthus annuus]
MWYIYFPFFAGLDDDYMRRRFGVLDMIQAAESLTKLKARCDLCGKRVSFTLKKTDETEREQVAGADVYIHRHHYASGQVLKETAKAALQTHTTQCGSLYYVFTCRFQALM